MNELEDCLKKGLLRTTTPSKENSLKSLKRAQVWIAQAKEACDAELYDASILASYEAMFHAARSLLIKDGYREKSHYCVSKYIEHVYSKKGLLDVRFVVMLDSYRQVRHQTAYNIEVEATKEEAEEAAKDSERFVEEMEKLL